ncbi:2Fe-2S iron-sulfur cluster-binding protein [Aeromonas rivuli]|uniref:2Fe-2S iron-sulfur cluster-binding protein n=1 Tax=Aeromonas rivuli TaxID=648794 RepID=UPI0005A98D4E|nr:2Fe-2S iron-sulfur cluster-binding protein [Aeromonas rivuli]
MPSITFLGSDVVIDSPDPIRLLDMDDHIQFACRAGNCGTCTINVVEGQDQLSALTPREQRLFALTKQTDTNLRLACQCKVLGDVILR